jgi:hypothetical protein
MKGKFLLFICSLLSVSSFGQFLKPELCYVDLRFGTGIHNYRFTDVTNNITGARDKGMLYEGQLNMEYRFLSWLGVAANATFAFHETDNGAPGKPVIDRQYGPTLNIHTPLGMERLDLFSSVGYSYSEFSYVENSSARGKAVAKGGVLNFGYNLRWRFKPGERSGIICWYKHSIYDYNRGTITDGNGNMKYFKLDGPVNSLGIGITF